MSDKAKEFFNSVECEIEASDLVDVGPYGEYGGIEYDNLFKLMQACADQEIERKLIISGEDFDMLFPKNQYDAEQYQYAWHVCKKILEYLKTKD